MVYGKILFNNIKEYTPKWYPTVPYSQTVKPTFGQKQQISWNFTKSDSAKRFYRNFAFVFQRNTFLWNTFIVGIMFVTIHICRDPLLMIYRANNKHRTYQAAITRQKAYKKKMKQQQEQKQSS